MTSIAEEIDKIIEDLEAQGNTILNVEVQILSALKRKIIIIYKTPDGTINTIEKCYIYTDVNQLVEVQC